MEKEVYHQYHDRAGVGFIIKVGSEMKKSQPQPQPHMIYIYKKNVYIFIYTCIYIYICLWIYILYDRFFALLKSRDQKGALCRLSLIAVNVYNHHLFWIIAPLGPMFFTIQIKLIIYSWKPNRPDLINSFSNFWTINFYKG